MRLRIILINLAVKPILSRPRLERSIVAWSLLKSHPRPRIQRVIDLAYPISSRAGGTTNRAPDARTDQFQRG
jgi:hypothetical protein